MGVLVEVVLPVFALIGLGRLAAWRRLLPEAAGESLTAFAFVFALPALLFRAVTGSAGIPLFGAVTFLGVALLVYAVGTLGSQRLLGEPLSAAGVAGLNAAFGNTVMMGIPVVSAAFGPEGLADLLAIVAFHSAVLMPVATVVVEAGLNARSSPSRLLAATLQSVLRNPIILAIIVGAAWAATGLAVPAVLGRVLDLLASSAAPVALFCLGLGLPAAPQRADLGSVAFTTLLKNLIMPGLVFLAMRAAGLPPLAVAVGTVAAAMPTGANAFLLARRYSTAIERSAAAVLVSTLLSLPVLGLLLVCFREP